MAPTCEKNVKIKLTPKNFLLIIFNVVYIEVNETRKKLWTVKQYIFKNLLLNTNWHEKHVKHILIPISVKQSLVSIILYNGFSNNVTDINDFLCKILGYW
jgi:hypothetical protein